MKGGYITNINPNKIAGFYLAEKKEEIAIEVNGLEVAKVIADQNSDFTTAKELGNCAFDVSISQYCTLHKNDDVKIYDSEKNLIAMLPAVFFYRLKLQQELKSDKERYFFIHVPKTAGTSFRNMLYEVFEQQEIFPNQKEISLNNDGYYTAKDFIDSFDKNLNRKLFVGHLPLDLIKLFPKRPKILTFLRDPYEQICSHINHQKTKNAKCKNMSYKQILMDVLPPNPQMRIFIKSRLPNDKITEQDFICAKNNLRLIDFCGITERFEESINLLSAITNLKMPKTLKMNAAKKDYGFSEIDELIHSRINYDKQFYDFANSLLTERLKNFTS